MKTIVFISNNSIGTGLSGGDRIFIELLKGWQKYFNSLLIGSEEAKDMLYRRGGSSIPAILSDSANTMLNPYTIFGLLCHHIRRLHKGLRALLNNRDIVENTDIVYSASDAFADFFPAFVLKMRRKHICWIAGYYLFIPSPFTADTPYKKGNWLRGCIYWLVQIPSYYLINRFADYVFVTSEPDVAKFITSKRSGEHVIVVKGGVDTTQSEQYLHSGNIIPLNERKYDGCFIGRLHYQKGVLELIDIWKLVTRVKPSAKLVMIGDGPLENEIKERIREAGLENNVHLVGFLDGEDKFAVFKQSKIIVHPASYDSGGMAAAEGMAWRLPAVSFDLEALKTYYPKGMLKTEKVNFEMFSNNILTLLENPDKYNSIADEARDLIVTEWDWRKRSERIYQQVFEPSV